MKLSPEDTALFYKLLWPLQFYLNQHLKIIPDVESVEEYRGLRTQDEKLQVRDAVYKNIHLLDAFTAENPAGFSADELAIVRNWKHFVAGKFYIERFLKKAAYFITADGPPTIYAVLGIQDSIKDIFAYRNPPILVEAVLLPFKGRIIHDGILQPFNVYFGSGIRGDLKEIYMAAKQNGRIIESLEPGRSGEERKAGRQVVERDWRPEVEAIVKASKKLKGQGVPIQSEAFALLKASARLAQAAVENPDDLDAVWDEERKVIRALNRLETVLHRSEM